MKKLTIPLVLLLILALASCGYVPVPEPTPEPVYTPEPTAEPEPVYTPEPTPEPEAESWTLCFAGDCTIGTLDEWQGLSGSNNMLYVMGDDLAYPFAGVSDILSDADFTMVNLEGAFTDRTRAKSKDYRFRAPTEYAAALPLGGIDAVSLANNHSGDYFKAGLDDTKAALDENGVLWADSGSPIITELGSLRLGVVAFNAVETDMPALSAQCCMERVVPLYEQCADAKCELIIAFMHWGWEYTDSPEPWMEELAHDMAELGFDMVIGSHSHVLQKAEYYNNVPILYSLGNFCYGGHSNPADKDSVIVRQTVTRDSDGGIVLGETEFIPCSISGTESRNDFSPVLFEEGTAGYSRVLQKLEAESFSPPQDG